MHWDPANYKHQELTEAIIHAFYEVYNELGYGFLESQSGFVANRLVILEPT
jgi:hypothetical protein